MESEVSDPAKHQNTPTMVEYNPETYPEKSAGLGFLKLNYREIAVMVRATAWFPGLSLRGSCSVRYGLRPDLDAEQELHTSTL